MKRWTLTLLIAMMCLATPLLAETEADRQFTFAVRLLRQGQADLAGDALTTFIRDYANDQRVNDARYYMALLHRNAGEGQQAMAQLSRVTNPMYVKPHSIHLLRGQLKLESGEAAGALADLGRIKSEDFTDHESRAAWQYLMGAAYRQTNDNEAAARQFARATEADSSVRSRALLELGKVRVAMRQFPQAMEALTEVPDTDAPASAKAEARLLAAQVAYELKQYEQSAALYQQVMQHHADLPQYQPAMIGLLRALLAADRNDALIAQHEALAAKLPADLTGEAWYLRAAAHVRLQQYDRAISAIEQFNRRTERHHPLTDKAAYLAGLCLYHTDAAKYEAWFVANRPDSRQLAYLRAAAAMDRDEVATAITHLTPLIDPPGAEFARRALLDRANLYEKAGQPQRAAADYALFAQRYGQDAQASDATRRAIDLAFAAGDHQQVIDRATAWLVNAPKNQQPTVQLKLAASLIQRGQNDRAAAVLDAVLKADPDDHITALAHYYRGLLLAGQANQGEAAITSLNAALQGPLPETQQTEAIALTARLYRLAGDDEKAITAYERLRRRAAADAFDPLTATWVGRGLYESGEYESALPWLEVATAHRDTPAEARAAAMFYAARSFQQLQRWPQAVEAYQQLLARTSAFGEQGRLGLAQSLVGAGDDESAMEHYNALINVRASAVSATALYESALLHLATADRMAQAGYADAAAEQTTEARRRLNRMIILHDVKELGSLPLRARLTLGRIEQQIDRRDLARQRFTEVAERNDHPAWAVIGRAELLQLDDQPTRAIALLQTLANDEQNKHDPAAVADARKRISRIR